jgi:hypothetical protein
MLDQRCLIEDLDLDQWKRLVDLGLHSRRARRYFVVHEGGKALRAYDSLEGEQALPVETVEDAQALADRLYADKKAAGVEQVWVLDPPAFHTAMGAVQASLDPKEDMDAYLAREFQTRYDAPGCAMAPKSGYILYGLPWGRLTRFVEKMLPPSCTFVLGVFDGDALWASVLVQFQDKRIVGISTAAALDPEDLKDIVGRDQHPFLLATVANRYRRPAFGWFCQREDFEKYMQAPTVEDKDEAFQRAIMENRATFDFNILVDRGITPLAPMNPGENAVAGADREGNPRTATPDPENPGPSAA